jgi:(E)-4-hydroxy-3-methylbut-2-enyl-diphosphate synthase
MNKTIKYVEVKLNDALLFSTSSPNYLLQSMTNTDTNDVAATVAQIVELKNAGADLVRVAVPGIKEITALRKIKNTLVEKNIYIPLVADVHFLPKVAEETATFVEKIRINPGNFSKNVFETMAFRAKPLFEICKQHNTIIRVGVNQGSLCERIISRYGNNAEALVVSALEWMDIAEMYDYHSIVFSIKSSHVKTMMNANLQFYNKMVERGRVYPFHLGVTEAANEMEGRVKSAIGIGGLLLSGLGNTFRVSLTENPIHEIAFSKLLTEAVQDVKDDELASVKDNVLHIHYLETNKEKWWAGVGALVGKAWQHDQFKDLKIENQYFSKKEIERLQDCVLQICNIKKTHTEIVACPSCGRTQYDIQTVLSEVRKHFSNYPHLKIAVMGCVVNGPGEMADADFGVIGNTTGKVAVYKGKERISDFVSTPEALKILQNTILLTTNH